MKTYLKTALALALVGVLNAGAFSAYAASAPDPTQEPARHHQADFAKAKALAPKPSLPPAPAERVPETDGLSRNVEDCNYGCVDN